MITFVRNRYIEENSDDPRIYLTGSAKLGVKGNILVQIISDSTRYVLYPCGLII